MNHYWDKSVLCCQYGNSGYLDKDGNPDNGCECLMDAQENDLGAACDPTDATTCTSTEVCVDRNLDTVYHCSAIPVDDCDGVDNDCDNLTDEDAPIGSECFPDPVGCTYDASSSSWSCVGECSTGFMGCVGGMIQCTQYQGPFSKESSGNGLALLSLAAAYTR